MSPLERSIWELQPDKKALKPALVPVDTRDAGQIVIGGRRLVDFTSWDVLGFAFNESLKRSVVSALNKFGFVSHSSRPSTGTSKAHLACERRFAQFFGDETALLFSSRNQCVLSVITTLFGEGDTVLFEEAGEAPIADACALVGATAIPFLGDDLESVEREFARTKVPGRRAVFVESVSAISGRVRELVAILASATRAGASLFVDDTAALGLYGSRGAADVGETIIPFSAELRFAGLTHGIGGVGACLSGRRVLIDSIIAASRNFLVEHPLPPFLAAGSLAALDLAELQISSRAKLKVLGINVCRGLNSFGIESFGDGPIVSAVFASHAAAKRYKDALLEHSVLVDALPCPVQFKERGVVRLIISSFHTDAQLGAMMNAFGEVHRRIIVQKV